MAKQKGGRFRGKRRQRGKKQRGGSTWTPFKNFTLRERLFGARRAVGEKLLNIGNKIKPKNSRMKKSQKGGLYRPLDYRNKGWGNRGRREFVYY